MRESGAVLEYTAVGQAPQAGGQDYTKGLRPLKPRRKSLSREYINTNKPEISPIFPISHNKAPYPATQQHQHGRISAPRRALWTP